MAIFKCKMCGGALEIQNNETVATCEYCGTQQTLPKLDDDKRSTLYDRANHFRRNNEFDKAMAIYEQILNEDNTDAEAYWSLVLCRYGIEYVEDPSSRKRVPTVNRAQFTAIFDDDNYKSALQYADSYQRKIYEVEAKAINEIQKGILAISQKEEPFDVFICYKETDASGRRTPDSVLANELYHELTEEGFKVFFARITLEDKLGSAYEPYIFAALNSAKVMVVLGTKPEYFKAVWVENEWSRYLALIKQGQKKMLIPAYKDMDPYDLPEEFAHLQAQDMSKLGFMQDLIRGIKKIAQPDAPKETVVKEAVIAGGTTSTDALLRRVYLFLEDGDWYSAEEYCEKVLDIDPENAKAYLGKLMVDLKVRRKEALGEKAEPFDKNSNYQKAVRFGDAKLKNELEDYSKTITDRIERKRLLAIYKKGQELFEAAETEDDFIDASAVFASIAGFENADEMASRCKAKANGVRLEVLYNEAVDMMRSAKTAEDFAEASKIFEEIKEYKNAYELSQECAAKAETIRLKTEAETLEKRRQEEQIVFYNKKIRNIWLLAQLGLLLTSYLFLLFRSGVKFDSVASFIGEIIASIIVALLFWGIFCGATFILSFVAMILKPFDSAKKPFLITATVLSALGTVGLSGCSFTMLMAFLSSFGTNEFSANDIFLDLMFASYSLTHFVSFVALISLIFAISIKTKKIKLPKKK